MNTTDFYDEIQKTLQNVLGNMYEVSLTQADRSEGFEDCIIIKKKSFTNIHSIPLTEFYEDFLSGYPIASIADDIAGIYEAMDSTDDLEAIIPYEYHAIKDKLTPRIVSLSQNPELLAKVPHISLPKQGLLIIFYVELARTHANCPDIRFLVTNRQLSVWNISRDAFIQAVLSSQASLFSAGEPTDT